MNDIKTSTIKKTIMSVAILLLWFSNYVYVPVFSTYCTSVGASISMVGIILGSYGLTQMMFRIPIGLISDRLKNRKFFLFLGMLTSCISSLGLYFFTAPVLLLLFRALSGIAVSNWAIYVTTYTALTDENKASKSIGTVNLLMALGQLLAVFLGGIIAQYIDVKFTFMASALSSFIGLILILFIDETYESKDNKPSKGSFFSVLKDSRLLFYSGLALLLQIILASSITGFLPTLLSNIGANEFEKGLGTMLGILPTVFAAPFTMGFLRQKLGNKWTGVLGFLFSTLPMFLLPFIGSIPVMLVLEFFAGFGKGIILPLFMYCSTTHLPANVKSTALSTFQAIYGVGMWIGPVVTGVISKLISLEAAFIGLGIVGVLSIVLLLLYKENSINKNTLPINH